MLSTTAQSSSFVFTRFQDDTAVVNRLVLGDGIDADSLFFARSGDDLVVLIGVGSDRATIKHYYSSSHSDVEEIELGGEVFNMSAFVNDDTIFVLDEADALNDNNDTLYDYAANDEISDNSNVNTFHFALGDGQYTLNEHADTDVINRLVLSDHIDNDSLFFARSGDDLVVFVGIGSDSITIKNYYGSTDTQITEINLRGEVFNLNTFLNDYIVFGLDATGSTEAPTGIDPDYVFVDNAMLNDDISNDEIENDANVKCYHFALGDGLYTLNEHPDLARVNRLVLGDGIDADSLFFARSYSDLVILIGIDSDRITIKNYYSSMHDQIEEIELDGKIFNLSIFTRDYIVLTLDATEETEALTETDNVNVRDALNSSDTFESGPLNDSLLYDEANDTCGLGSGQEILSQLDNTTSFNRLVLSGVINRHNLSFARLLTDLVIFIGDGSNRITIKKYYASAYDQIADIVLNGEVFSLATLLANYRESIFGAIDNRKKTNVIDEVNRFGGIGSDVFYGYVRNNKNSGGVSKGRVFGDNQYILSVMKVRIPVYLPWIKMGSAFTEPIK